MKQPRIEDYDPNARERKLQSPLDDLPSIQRRSKREDLLESPAHPVVRTSGRTSVRKKSRWPFEIFQDQIDELQQLSLEAKSRGERGSMSEMVREALDDYLRKVRSGTAG